MMRHNDLPRRVGEDDSNPMQLPESWISSLQHPTLQLESSSLILLSCVNNNVLPSMEQSTPIGT